MNSLESVDEADEGIETTLNATTGAVTIFQPVQENLSQTAQQRTQDTQESATPRQEDPERVDTNPRTKMSKAEIACDTFVYGRDPATLGQRWQAWSERFQLYVDANGLDETTDAKRIKASYLLLMGPDAMDVYRIKRKPDSTDTLAEIQKFMREHFVVKKSEYSEIVTFRRAFRHEGETVNDYAMRLRALAKHCNFDTGLDKEIERQFVVGCNMPEVQNKCTRESELDLTKVLSFANGYERVYAGLDGLKQNTPNGTAPKHINYMSGPSRSSNERSGTHQSAWQKPVQNCSCCGRATQHKDRTECPAWGASCNSCGKLNHYARVCRSNNKVKEAQHDKAGVQHHKERGGNRRVDQRIRKLQTGSAKADGEAEGKAPDEETFRIGASEYAEYLRYKELCKFELKSITMDQANVNQIHVSAGPRATIHVKDSPICMIVDTGSPVNVMDEATYQQLDDKPALEKCSTSFYGYASNTPLQIIGQFVAPVRRGEKKVSGEFVVVKGRHECLLSYTTATQLKIITISPDLEVPRVVKSVAISEDEREWSLAELKAAYPALFSGKLGCLKDVKIKLEMDPRVKPVAQPLRPVAIHLRDAVTTELLKQVEEGILVKVKLNSAPTPWISNLVVVPKEKAVRNAKCGISRPAEGEAPKTFAVRLTCDSRAVNKAIRRTRHPGKTIEDLAYSVNGAKWFSKLDITKAFHQIAIDPESRVYTTITTHIGLFQYLRLHMGIAGATEMFTEAIRIVLLGLPGQINMTDDILVYGENKKAHQRNLLAVLKRLEDAGLTLNIDKCQFYKTELTFFGLRFTSDGMSPTEDRCEALRKAARPENAKELHSFLCTVLYSSRFIRNVCNITEPLWRLVRNKTEWKWGEVEQQAFEELKQAISMDCVAYFDKTWYTELTVDASPVGLGAVLGQVDPNDPKRRRIVCFASRLLTDVESRYSQCEKEALAAVWGCERFWLYLTGHPFTLVTDNRAIQMILSNTNSRPPPRIERMALRLTQFDFTVCHRPGNENVADYYSRHPCSPGATAFLEELKSEQYIRTIVHCAMPDAVTMAAVAEATVGDSELQQLIKNIAQNEGGKALSGSLESYRPIFDELSVSTDGVVLRGSRIVVPASLRNQIVQLAHAGHQGVVKTKAYIRSRVWFPAIDRMVEKQVAECRECQAAAQRVYYEPMKPSMMPAGPWQEVSGDFFGPMDDGAYWFVNHCEHSRWASVDRVRSTSFECVQGVLEPLFVTFGVPVEYKSDNGPPFQSHNFASFAKQWGFRHRKITPLWPRANAECESFMKKLGKVVRAAAISGRSKEQELQEFLVAYRATPHSTTGVPPALLMLNRRIRTAIPETDQPLSIDQVRSWALKHDREAKSRMKREYDLRMNVRERRLCVGDLVLVLQAKSRKSSSKWDPNPYTITRVHGTMVTAARPDRVVTRNASHFKLLRCSTIDDDVVGPEALMKEPSRATSGLSDVEQSRAVAEPYQTGQSMTAGAEAVAEPSQPEKGQSMTVRAEAVAEPGQPKKGNRGRPDKARAAVLDRQRLEAEMARRKARPPIRQSERVLAKK